MTNFPLMPHPYFDEVLGAATQRYFTAGYKRVRHQITLISVAPHAHDGGTVVRATGRAMYPHDWSLDPSGEPRRAHLSSIDALVMTVAALELLAESTPAYVSLACTVLTNVTIRAGTHPVLDLDNIPVLVHVHDGDPHVDSMSDSAGAITVIATVGEFTVKLAATRDSPRIRVDERAVSVYMEGFRSTHLESAVVAVDPAARELSTRHRATIAPLTARGVDSPAWPCLTHVDNVVLFGQIAQVMVQLIEGVPRGSIDNLWMRRLSFERHPATESLEDFSVDAALTSHSHVTRAGRTMHSLELRATSGHGVTAAARFGFVEAT